MKKLKFLLFDKSFKIEEIIFRWMCLFGVVSGGLCGLAEMLEGQSWVAIGSLWVLALGALIWFIYSAFGGDYNRGYILFYLTEIILFPAIFITAGGVQSAITLYFVTNAVFFYIYDAGERRKLCNTLLVIYVLEIVACYVYSWMTPSLGADKPTQLVHTEHIIGSLLCMFTLGNLVRLQISYKQRERDRAVRAEAAKGNFLATVSHEIRTPMNAILGLGRIESEREDLPPSTRETLEKMISSGELLLNIINDLLDISKIDSGKLEIVPDVYDIPSLVNDTAQLNMGRIGSKPIEFHLSISPLIPSRLKGDQLRIKQILNNLLTNAIKYTKEGHIYFVVNCLNHDSLDSRIEHPIEQPKTTTELIFTVQDTGIGIKPEDLGKLFSEYGQVNTRANRNIEGTGLGLSIAKKLVTMMGGTIEVQSVYGKGSTFIVRIPQEVEDDTPIGDAVGEGLSKFQFTAERKNKTIQRELMPYGRVLVVDDVLTNLDVAQGFLLPYQIQAECVQNAPEAIEILRAGKTHFDCVFMDHMMPGMDGIEATRLIREFNPEIPVIALTANAVAGMREMFLENGFNGFISKPIDIREMDVVLHKFVKR